VCHSLQTFSKEHLNSPLHQACSNKSGQTAPTLNQRGLNNQVYQMV